jgi:hypothetical protein
VLEESANGGNDGTYLLDDQSAARKYEGWSSPDHGDVERPLCEIVTHRGVGHDLFAGELKESASLYPIEC